MAKPWAEKLYHSKEWASLRAAALARDKGMCQAPGCYNPAEEVHHKIELTESNVTDPRVALNLDNLTCLCRECHMRHHYGDRVKALREAMKKRKPKESEILEPIRFDSDGLPILSNRKNQ